MNDFFASIYELLYYADPFSYDLYNEGLYSPIGLTAIISSLIVVTAFYYIINHPRFNKWIHWVVMLIVNFVINFLVAAIVPQNVLSSIGLEYGSEYYIFALMAGLVSVVLFIVISFSIRWKSRNCSRTPIPN